MSDGRAQENLQALVTSSTDPHVDPTRKRPPTRRVQHCRWRTADQTRLPRIITNPAHNHADAADGDTHVEIGDY